MKLKSIFVRGVQIGMAVVFMGAFFERADGKCQADKKDCDDNAIAGGQPTACRTASVAWSHGSCNSGFSNYQCDIKCVGNTVPKTDWVQAYTQVVKDGVVVECKPAGRSETPRQINCPQNVACDNKNDCE